MKSAILVFLGTSVCMGYVCKYCSIFWGVYLSYGCFWMFTESFAPQLLVTFFLEYILFSPKPVSYS